MAETALRAYLQEIDDLIEHEQLDEAIAHARHILQTYPKHLESYRLLGKGYLEAKRYGDAADLFQRVLSAIPDDFVSHIGMSIVREDEGNLDASIWHMERAFETNPANPAIQQELRRLIGRRDGLEPHKVRLTRGALARMYAHGELYPQAIAELRSALHEDSDRPDLQALLAEMYWRTDQKVEAADVCSKLLDKLPFCREALRIMAAVLQSGGKIDESAVYHRRLASLDPYTAFLESAVGDPKTVDAGSVRIEKLAWHPGQPVPSAEPTKGQWTGASRPAPAEQSQSVESMPAWLRSLEPSGPPAAAASAAVVLPVEGPTPIDAAPSEAAAASLPAADADIPNWMREAGWKESTGAAVEGPVTFSDDELLAVVPTDTAPAEDELQPADIPEWLRDMAPGPGGKYPPEPDTQPAPVPASAGLPDWLGEFESEGGMMTAAPTEAAPPAPAPPTPQPLFADEPETAPPQLEPAEVPTWLTTPADGATETIVTWLGRRGDAPGEPTPAAPVEPLREPIEDETPSWVGRMQSTGAAQAAPPSKPPLEELPSWLTGVAEAASQDSGISESELEAFRPAINDSGMPEDSEDEIPAVQAVPAEAPDWLREIAEPESELAEAASPPQPEADGGSGVPEVPEWLGRSLDAGMTARAEGGAEPEWLQGIGEPPVEAAAAAPSGAEPDWLRGIEDETADAPTATNWLNAIRESAAAAEDEAPAAPLTPPWLEEPLEGAGLEKPTEVPSEAEMPEPPAWLRGVPEAPSESSGQGLLSDATLASPRSEAASPGNGEEPAPGIEPAIWMREFAESTSQVGAEEAQEELAPAEVPDWLKGFGGAEGAPPIEEPEEPEFEGALNWLQETASTISPDPVQTPSREAQAPPVPPPEPFSPEPVAEDEVMRWLEELAARQPAGAADTTLEPLAIAPRETTPAARSSLPEDAEESMEWLEQLAAESDATQLGIRRADIPQPADTTRRPSSEPTTGGLPPEPVATEGEAAAFVGTGAASTQPAAPEADETLPSRPRPTFGPRAQDDKRPGTTPLSEGEVVEWLRTTASASRATRVEPPAESAAEPAPLPREADQATEFAIQLLQAGRAALTAGDLQAAVQAFTPVIQRGLLLNSVIEDLKRAVEEKPDATPLWQALGDAYKKANLLPEAIKAYSRAMKEEDGLELARQALKLGDLALAVMHYGSLIKRKQNLDDVITDLRGAVDAEPKRPALWQALGDAYMKANRLSEAIDAYRRGMESV